ncbi:MAG: hypothetical protein D8H95_40260 [Lachnospiraceae bacterium]|jgi:hypothetical protein|nr:MAG: hypothetical protein D8H95_40260 [Lachnospiraceae bacterium]
MHLRNIIEFLVIAFFLIVGIIIYMYIGKKINDVESDLTVRHKRDFNEKVEDVPSIDEEYKSVKK